MLTETRVIVLAVGIAAGTYMLGMLLWALPVLAVGLAALLAAPLAEETWLEEVYGDAYRNYKSRVGRFI